jgi:hypothetical protein
MCHDHLGSRNDILTFAENLRVMAGVAGEVEGGSLLRIFYLLSLKKTE